MRLLSALAVAAIAFAAAFLFIQPIFSGIHNWGIYDWDQHMFYHESARISFLTFHEFPLWTPYQCGGNVLLANPQSPFLSPFFVFVLLFGAVVGLKVEALVYLAIGLAGTFLVARKLGCNQLASALAAAVFMFSSWFSARVAAGHTTFFPFALLPFAFLFYINSVSSDSIAPRVRFSVFAAFILAIMFLSGGIYPFYAGIVLLALYSLLDSLSMRKIWPVMAFVIIVVMAFVLSSVKLLPVLDFASGVGSDKDVQLTSVKIVFSSLLSRDQSFSVNDLKTGRDLVPEGRDKELAALSGEVAWGWHEYSAYIGFISLALASLALLNFRKNWKLLVSALFFFLLAFGAYLPVGPWQLLREIPFFGSLHGPSRFMIVFVFIVGLLAAKAVSSLKIPGSGSAKAAFSFFLLLLAAAAVIDTAIVSRDVLAPSNPAAGKTAFPRAPLEIRSTNLGSPEIIQMYSSAPYLSQYPYLLQGIGTVNCYERIHLRQRVIPQLVDGEPYPGFIGNAYIAETNSSLNFTYFSPHKISLRLPEILQESTLVINQNYYKGWDFDGFSGEAGSYRGLLAALVQKEDSGKEVSFSYSSRSFVIGAFISALAVAVAVLLLLRPRIAVPLARLAERIESYVFRQS